MNAGIPEPTAVREEGADTGTFSTLQRLLAGIALIALLASAAISSWWILSGQADFTDARDGTPTSAEKATETRTPPDQRRP